MTNRTKKLALAAGAALLLVVAVIGYRMFVKRPTLVWDASAGATHYEVQIDGTMFGTYTETRVQLPAGFSPQAHKIQVRACTGPSCSPWQPLTEQ